MNATRTVEDVQVRRIMREEKRRTEEQRRMDRVLWVLALTVCALWWVI